MSIEAVRRIREYIKARPGLMNNTNAWIEGGGWDHMSWPEGTWPTAVSGLSSCSDIPASKLPPFS